MERTGPSGKWAWPVVLAIGCVGQDLAPTAASAAASEDVNRFNVLVLAVDDLRPELGCYGVEWAETPHIDALAAEGVAFLSHFTQVPTCGASRYGLLTGRSAARSGVRSGNQGLYQGPAKLSTELLDGAQSLPELFRRSGYHTTLVGKLSHTPDGRVFAYDGSGDGRAELPHAWDELATPFGPWLRGWGAFFAYAGGNHREDGGGHRQLLEFAVEQDEQLPDGLMASAAIEVLRERAAADEPFFMGLGFFKPHLPFVAPRSDWEAVQDRDVQEPVHPARLPSAYWHPSGEFYGYEAAWSKTRPLAAEDARTARRAYLACVRYVDRQIGRVLQALEEEGLAQSTIVVLWGDHGWFLGEGALWGKHAPLEEALRSPLIVRVPGMETPAATTDALVSTLDIYPTLVELCRPRFTTTAEPLDGVSLVPLLEGEADSVREVVRGYWQDAITVRDGGYRFVGRQGAEGWQDEELYDLRMGAPWGVDVAASHPEVVRRLRELAD